MEGRIRVLANELRVGDPPRAEDGETEFITLLRFETLDAVKLFAGKNHEQPVIPPACRPLLKRHSKKSHHYRIVQIN